MEVRRSSPPRVTRNAYTWTRKTLLRSRAQHSFEATFFTSFFEIGIDAFDLHCLLPNF